MPTLPCPAPPEPSAEPTAEPTEVITATTEPTAEATPEDAADDTGDDTGDLDTQTMGNFVIRAGELVGMSLVDDAGEQMAIVDELLVDESGAVKYVIVESLAIGDGAVDDDLTTDDATTDDTADDAATDDTLQDDPAVGPANTVALSWDSINVVSGTVGADADDGAPGDGEISLVYSGDTALAEQTAFDATMLDEEGSILDDQAVGDEDVTIPSEFADLIQLGEFGDFNLTNSEGDDLGEIEDVLIDVNAGQVAYAIVDVGGFLGIGEKQVAIPWQAFQIDVTVEDDAEEESFMLDATEDELENAPGLDLDDWNPEVETDWDADLRGYWEATDMNMGTDSETDTETDTDTDTESGTDS